MRTAEVMCWFGVVAPAPPALTLQTGYNTNTHATTKHVLSRSLGGGVSGHMIHPKPNPCVSETRTLAPGGGQEEDVVCCVPPKENDSSILNRKFLNHNLAIKNPCDVESQVVSGSLLRRGKKPCLFNLFNMR